MTALGLAPAEYGAVGSGLSLVVSPIRPKRSGSRRWRRLSNEVIDSQGGQCLICGERGSLTCHHLLARRDGGTDIRENLIGLCAPDHTIINLLERDIPFISRCLIAVMVILGPSQSVCRFFRLVFPLLIRRGIGFHPATLRLRPLRQAASATCTAVLACLFAAAAFAQAPLDADTILRAREREAHERAAAERVAYQTAKQPPPRAIIEPEAPARHLSPQQMRELSEALERYFHENARAPLLWEAPRDSRRWNR